MIAKFKYTVKIADTLKATVEADVGDGDIGVDQKVGGVIDPQIIDIVGQ